MCIYKIYKIIICLSKFLGLETSTSQQINCSVLNPNHAFCSFPKLEFEDEGRGKRRGKLQKKKKEQRKEQGNMRGKGGGVDSEERKTAKDGILECL